MAFGIPERPAVVCDEAHFVQQAVSPDTKFLGSAFAFGMAGALWIFTPLGQNGGLG